MTGSMNHGPNLLSYSTLLTKLEKELGFMSRSSLSLYKLTLNCNFSYLLSVVDCQWPSQSCPGSTCRGF